MIFFRDILDIHFIIELFRIKVEAIYINKIINILSRKYIKGYNIFF
jgi:hypothetical protein